MPLARATNPEKIPENIGRKSGALRNVFRNPRNASEKSPEKFSGLLSNARQGVDNVLKHVCVLSPRILPFAGKKLNFGSKPFF